MEEINLGSVNEFEIFTATVNTFVQKLSSHRFNGKTRTTLLHYS